MTGRISECLLGTTRPRRKQRRRRRRRRRRSYR